jgi:hypothetical protein
MLPRTRGIHFAATDRPKQNDARPSQRHEGLNEARSPQNRKMDNSRDDPPVLSQCTEQTKITGFPTGLSPTFRYKCTDTLRSVSATTIRSVSQYEKENTSHATQCPGELLAHSDFSYGVIRDCAKADAKIGCRPLELAQILFCFLRGDINAPRLCQKLKLVEIVEPRPDLPLSVIAWWVGWFNSAAFRPRRKLMANHYPTDRYNITMMVSSQLYQIFGHVPTPGPYLQRNSQ